MKKLLIGLAVLVVAAGAVWSALWFTGRGQIEDQMELELARLEANGTTVTWQDRTIGGFPFGYEVVAEQVGITNRENGILVRIPQVVSQADASDIDRVETSLIGEIQIDVPITEELRKSDPRLPRIVNIRMTGDDLRIAIEGLAGNELSYLGKANQLALEIDQEDMPNRVNLSASGLDGKLARADGKWTFGTQAGQFDFSVDGTDETGVKSEFEIGIGTLSLTMAAEQSGPVNLNEIVFGNAEGSIEVAYSAGIITSRAVASAPAGGGGTLRYSGSAGTGIIGIQDGVMEVRTESRENAWIVEPEDTETSVHGTVQADTVQASYRLPTAPTDEPKPAGFRLAVVGLDGDETFWKTLDPGSVLDRSASEMLVDIEATAMVTDRLDVRSPTGRIPLFLSNISVNDLNVSALGGKVQASGDIEVLQPINLPLGKLDVRISKAYAVLNGLMRAGLIDEPTWTAATAMLQVYARPAEGDDMWETDVIFGNDGITVNGLQVQ